MLIGAIKNGATQVSSFSSNTALESGACSGPVKPLDNANGFASTANNSGFSFNDAMVALNEAAVPPENSPFIALTLPLILEAGFPCSAITLF